MIFSRSATVELVYWRLTELSVRKKEQILCCMIVHFTIYNRFCLVMLVDPSKVYKKKLLATCTSPLKPQFYTVKLGFTGVYIIFLISAQNIARGYSLESPHRGNSNEYPQSMF